MTAKNTPSWTELGPRWFVEACAQPSATSQVEVRGATIWYEVWGPGGATNVPPLLLLHGTAANRHWWTHVAALLAESRVVIALDLSGHGDSSHRAVYNFDTWVEEVAEVLRAAVPADRPAWVVGHSLGGSIAAATAQRTDLPIEAVVLCETIRNPRDAHHPRMVDRPRAYYPTRETALARFGKVESQKGGDYVIERVAERSIVERDEGWTWKHDTTLPMILQPIVPALDDLLPAARCPVSIIRGDRGMVRPQDVDALVAVAGSMMSVVTLLDSGHHPMVDAPLALVDALRDLTVPRRDSR